MYEDLWTYREDAYTPRGAGTDIVGYSVEAIDGSIGKIDEATHDTGSSYLVVDTGPWIFGRKVMLPAGVIRSVDSVDETVYVNRTKDEIKDSPEYDETRREDNVFREELSSYYGPEGRGYRSW
jgi:hypothetical protein